MKTNFWSDILPMIIMLVVLFVFQHFISEPCGKRSIKGLTINDERIIMIFK